MTRAENIIPIFLSLPPQNIVRLKFLLESYEGLGELRTLDSLKGDVVILALPDTLDAVRRLVESLYSELSLREIPPPLDVSSDWLLREFPPE